MTEQLFFLMMKDHWSAEDFAEYRRLTAKAPTAQTQKPVVYNIGDIKTDTTGTWKKIDQNTWECLY